MWKINNKQEKQTLEWKHGRVVLTQSILHQKKSNTILISTPPFEGDIVIQANEQNKSMKTTDQLLNQMYMKNVNRQYTVFIKGGGCLLDMAGFACSIYMRGVKNIVYMPTTLLAIVDATVGGKNGINWNGAKNMLGVTRHPQQIIIDINFLYTLSRRDFANGLAEVIKMAITHDKDLLEYLQNSELSLSELMKPVNKQKLKHIIRRSLQIKIKVVEGDQFDRSSRKWLNFGHTIGHGLQLNPESQDLKHGQCVAIGLMQQLKLCQQIGQLRSSEIIKRVQNILVKYELPTKIPEDVNKNQIVKAMLNDKKNTTQNMIQFPMIQEIGIRNQSTTSLSPQRLQSFFNKGVRISIPNINQFQAKSKQLNERWVNRFPSSKSLSIRYLFLSALYFLQTKQPLTITDFLQSQDTQHIKSCLQSLGFIFQYQKQLRVIRIVSYSPKAKGQLDVGNSGLTARFILPLCCFIRGQWTISCHKRMSQRPNQQIIEFCQHLFDVQFTFNKNQNCFPLKVISTGKVKQVPFEFNMKSQKSSQFISSILLNSCLLHKELIINTNENRVSESYIKMTISCLESFGFEIIPTNQKICINAKQGFSKIIKQIRVQKDLSSLSYPYAFSLMHDISLPQLPSQSVQGDVQFYEYCQQIKHQILDNQNTTFYDLFFSNCTDTFMTMSVLIGSGYFNAFLNKNNNKIPILRIHEIANQKIKESDRIQMIRKNLQKVGIFVHYNGSFLQNVCYKPNYELIEGKKQIVFETAGDHRIAMSMAILSTHLAKVSKNVDFIIDDKNAVKKTFPEFWQYLRDSGVRVSQQVSEKDIKNVRYFKKNNSLNINKNLLLVGNRGCGKSYVGRNLAQKTDSIFIDLDEETTKKIQQNYKLSCIAKHIQFHGWQSFRRVELMTLIEVLQGKDQSQNWFEKRKVISTGGGIVDWQESRVVLKNRSQEIPIVYIEKQFSDLKIQHNEQRPVIQNFKEISGKRQQHYEDISNFIITVPHFLQPKEGIPYEKINKYIFSQYDRIKYQKALKEIPQGYILCCNNDMDIISPGQYEQLSAIQLRVDEIMNSSSYSMKELRFALAKLKIINNNYDNLPIITTLRSKSEYGKFEGDYKNMMSKIRKIPTNFLDHQVKYPLSFNYNKDKILHSYHGHTTKYINILMNKIQGNTKLCYDGNPLSKSQFLNLKSSFNICVDFNNPVTRLLNKHQMIIPQKYSPSLSGTGIGTKLQMKALSKLIHMFK